jgi:UDP-2-acetamido-2-deoxy-ribo-hexuluronate aminotransferase
MEFVDLKSQYQNNKAAIDRAIADVLDHGRFIMGPEVSALEDRISAYCGAKHAVTCANGTDALQLALMGEGVGAGDAVFLPSFTFTATAEVVLLLGAVPVFCDVDETYFNIDPNSLRTKIADTRAAGDVRPAAIIAVDLFGMPADYSQILAIASDEQMLVIADAAQSFGASQKNKRVGCLADISTTSFFPAKPLGCYGDGGALFTDDDERANHYRSLRAHGKAIHKYDISRIGVNSRLDTIQAAVLLQKLDIFPDEIENRNKIARQYTERLSGLVGTPRLPDTTTSVWAQYTIKTKKRDAVAQALKNAGIPTAIYYPLPMHLQEAYKRFGEGPGSLPTSEKLCKTVLSLPIHPYLTDDEVETISREVEAVVATA